MAAELETLLASAQETIYDFYDLQDDKQAGRSSFDASKYETLGNKLVEDYGQILAAFNAGNLSDDLKDNSKERLGAIRDILHGEDQWLSKIGSDPFASGATVAAPAAANDEAAADEATAPKHQPEGPLKKIYVECNPLLDISAHVDEAFLEKYNLQKASAALCTPEQMEIYNELAARSDAVFIPGGSALNTARVAQWMSQAEKQSLVTFVGAIADDKYGKILKDAAEEEGVTMAVQYSSEQPTGTCAVCIVGKERSLLANLAAANTITPAHLDTAPVLKAMEEANIFYFSGFTLTISTEHVLKAAKKCRAVGGTFCMNLSAPFIVQYFGDQLKEVLPYVDIIFANEDEAKAFANARQWFDIADDLAAVGQKLCNLEHNNTDKMVQRHCVFTQGSQCTVWSTPNFSGSVDVPAIDASKIVDTNGAGDAFVGGYLAALSMGHHTEVCCAAGHYAAGVVIQHDGCTFPPKPNFTWELEK